MWTRREFIRVAGTEALVAGMLAGSGSRAGANPLGLPIGSQTWPHRALIAQGRFGELLDQFAAIGVGAIELCSALDYEDFRTLADGKAVRTTIAGHGLTCNSAHFGMKELRTRQQESLAWAHDVGITQVITATLGAGAHPTMDDVKRAAEEYNRIAAVTARAGLQQGLHNEGFELSEVDGRRTYDVLLELLDPALVKFQFQMSTIANGFVAADYFSKYPGRFTSIHVQDVDLTAPRNEQGRPPQVPVGQGSIDWVKTFTAAKAAGITSYYVEQSWDLTKASVAYLKTLRV
jgi:sugar phosphate isomerase/epimerase